MRRTFPRALVLKNGSVSASCVNMSVTRKRRGWHLRAHFAFVRDKPDAQLHRAVIGREAEETRSVERPGNGS